MAQLQSATLWGLGMAEEKAIIITSQEPEAHSICECARKKKARLKKNSHNKVITGHLTLSFFVIYVFSSVVAFKM